jgi:hypothetical protein
MFSKEEEKRLLKTFKEKKVFDFVMGIENLSTK